MEPALFTWLEQALLLVVFAGVLLLLLVCLRIYRATATQNALVSKDYRQHIEKARLAGKEGVTQTETDNLTVLSQLLSEQESHIANALLPAKLQFSVSLSDVSVLSLNCASVSVEVTCKGFQEATPSAETADTLSFDSTTFQIASIPDDASSLIEFTLRSGQSNAVQASCSVSPLRLIAETKQTEPSTIPLRLCSVNSEDEDAKGATLHLQLLPAQGQRLPSSSRAENLTADLDTLWERVYGQLQASKSLVAGIKSRLNAHLLGQAQLVAQLHECQSRNDALEAQLSLLSNTHNDVLEKTERVVSDLESRSESKDHEAICMKKYNQELWLENKKLEDDKKQLQAVLAREGISPAVFNTKLVISVSCHGLQLQNHATVMLQMYNNSDQQPLPSQRTEPRSTNSPSFKTRFNVKSTSALSGMYAVFTVSDSKFPEEGDRSFDLQERELKRQEAAAKLRLDFDSFTTTKQLGKVRIPLFKLVPTDPKSIIKASFPLSPAEGTLCLEVQTMDQSSEGSF